MLTVRTQGGTAGPLIGVVRSSGSHVAPLASLTTRRARSVGLVKASGVTSSAYNRLGVPSPTSSVRTSQLAMAVGVGDAVALGASVAVVRTVAVGAGGDALALRVTTPVAVGNATVGVSVGVGVSLGGAMVGAGVLTGGGDGTTGATGVALSLGDGRIVVTVGDCESHDAANRMTRRSRICLRIARIVIADARRGQLCRCRCQTS